MLRAGARSLEHCYLIDDEGVAMAEKAGAFLVPTMELTRHDKVMLNAGQLPQQAVPRLQGAFWTDVLACIPRTPFMHSRVKA